MNIAAESAINLTTTITAQEACAIQPRAIGTAVLSVRPGKAGQTRIGDLRQSGSLKLVFPRTFRADIETVLVNTAGGITGGDYFAADFDVQRGATLTVTTQAAERAYQAQPGTAGRVQTDIDVQSDAQLHWLPQELILFERSALRRRLAINLAAEARLLMVEPVIFGRVAMGEALRHINFQDRITITRAGKPLYIDAVHLRGDATAHLARNAIANGAGAMASLVLVRPDAAAQLAPIRAALPDTAGASLIADDTLVMRQLAADGYELRRALLPILDRLTDNALPTSWRL